MKDLLFRFASEAEAAPVVGTGEGAVCWKMSDDLTDVARTTVILLDETLDTVDPETGDPIRGTRPAEGVWYALCTSDNATAVALRSLPGFAVEFERPETEVTDWRETVTAFGLTDVNPAELRIATVSPSWAGGLYRFD